MREFGGSEALPDLTELLDDNEPQVQREAVRAILNIGTDAGLPGPREGARHAAPTRSRDAIMQSHRLRATSARRRSSPTSCGTSTTAAPSRPIYLRAIESLGRAARPEGVAPLEEALVQGEWWAPRRTARASRGRGRRARADRDAGGLSARSRSRRRRVAAASAPSRAPLLGASGRARQEGAP